MHKQAFLHTCIRPCEIQRTHNYKKKKKNFFEGNRMLEKDACYWETNIYRKLFFSDAQIIQKSDCIVWYVSYLL